MAGFKPALLALPDATQRPALPSCAVQASFVHTNSLSIAHPVVAATSNLSSAREHNLAPTLLQTESASATVFSSPLKHIPCSPTLENPHTSFTTLRLDPKVSRNDSQVDALRETHWPEACKTVGFHTHVASKGAALEHVCSDGTPPSLAAWHGSAYSATNEAVVSRASDVAAAVVAKRASILSAVVSRGCVQENAIARA